MAASEYQRYTNSYMCTCTLWTEHNITMHMPGSRSYHWLLTFMSQLVKYMELNGAVYIPRSGAAEAAHLRRAGIMMNSRDTWHEELT